MTDATLPNTTPPRSAAAVLALVVSAAVATLALSSRAMSVPVPDQNEFLQPAGGESLADWTERWMEGPVQYIATEEERDVWRSLQATQERLQFIRLFWERRDPRVRGRANGFLEEFERRVAHADEEFGSGDRPGWKTLFGRVVLVLGPPDRVRREIDVAGIVSDRPPILWTYDRRIPQWPPNEDLLFVFQRGRWRLMPPSPIGDGGVDRARRELERATLIAELPTDFEQASQATIQQTLVRPVDYREAIRPVEASVAFPDAAIPFGWDASFGAFDDDRREVFLELTWRVESLIFHVVDGNFQTEMEVRATLSGRDGEPVAQDGDVFNVQLPVAELESRAGELVERSLSLAAPAGSWQLELVLEDRLLGYRTVYRDTLEVPEG